MTDIGTAPAVTDGETTHDEDQRREFVASLRAVADFLEQTPDVPMPLGESLSRHFTSLDAYRAACEALGGTHDPRSSSSYDVHTRYFGPIALRFQVGREALIDERERLLTQREAELAR